jgi:hypothetical protein
VVEEEKVQKKRIKKAEVRVVAMCMFRGPNLGGRD